VGYIEPERLGRALGDDLPVAVAQLHTVTVAHDLERALERRREAQRHRDLLGSYQFGDASRGVAAVRRGRRPVEPRRDGQRLGHSTSKDFKLAGTGV
jgi:hypothetical protein